MPLLFPAYMERFVWFGLQPFHCLLVFSRSEIERAMEADVIKNLLGPIDDFEDSLLTTVCRNDAYS
jgi:hypothetical protein